jgi:hypothetical protein
MPAATDNLVIEVGTTYTKIYYLSASNGDGTLTTTGTTKVTGTNTNFTTYFTIGDIIQVGTDFAIVDVITNDASLTTLTPLLKHSKVNYTKPIDITGYNIYSEIRPLAGSDELIQSFTTTILDAIHGIFSISLDDETTTLLPYDKLYYFDIKVSDLLDNVTRLVQGSVTISPEVTIGVG